MMTSYTFSLVFLIIIAIIDVAISATVAEVTPLAQLVVQLVLHVITALIVIGLYMRTVLIALPPTATGLVTWFFVILNFSRLAFLILVRVLNMNQTINRINILFDAFNVLYWWSIFSVSLQLGKSKYYSYRFAFT